jgi:transposase
VAHQAVAGAQKGALQAGWTIVWVDETGCSLLPGCVRTYAPRGQTPTLDVPVTYDHLAAIGGVTFDGTLLLRVHARPLRGPDVVRFLRHLLAHLPGTLLVIWDGAPIHDGHAVQDFLATDGAARLRVAPLPGYAPDLNPLDQGIWHYLKDVELANVCCADLPTLQQELRLAVARLRHKRHIIQAAIRHAGYQL